MNILFSLWDLLARLLWGEPQPVPVRVRVRR